jgi:hypothetical protein
MESFNDRRKKMQRLNSLGKVCFASAAFFVQPFPNADFFSTSRGASFTFRFDPGGAFRADERDILFPDCKDFRIGEFDEAFRFFGSA